MHAAEVALDCKVRSAWVDTAHQPADGGTRVLSPDQALGSVFWQKRCRIAEAFPQDAIIDRIVEQRLGKIIITDWTMALGAAC